MLIDYKVPEKDAGTVDLAGLRWQWQMTTIAMETIPGFKRIEVAVRLLGAADGASLGRTSVDEDQPALARLTGYISDPELVRVQ